ncbi:hypothetical protein pb186bvf_014761 [Paramecium bursaria]
MLHCIIYLRNNNNFLNQLYIEFPPFLKNVLFLEQLHIYTFTHYIQTRYLMISQIPKKNLFL